MNNFVNKDGLTEEEFLKNYKPGNYERPSVTVDVLVLGMNEKLSGLKVLLVQRKNHPYINCWALPGGFVDINESAYEAAGRELEEETGIKNLPLMQMATWGDFDRDPRWRVITTSYLALVEGDLAVQAGDDAADALWFKVRLDQVLNDQEQRKELWNLTLVNEEKNIQVGAKVAIERSGHKLLEKKQYRIVENENLAADHGCLITQALLYLKGKLENI